MKKFLLFAFVVMLAGTGWAEKVTLKYDGTAAGNMTGGNDAELLGLDANTWKVVGAKGATDHFPALTTDGEIILDWSVDGGNELSVSLLNGNTIKSIDITYTSANEFGNAYVTVDGTRVEGSNSVYQINSTSFVVGNAYTVSHQVKIKAIAIEYNPETAAVATPVITLDPANGPYYTGQTVTASITCATDGAFVYYAIDNGEWTWGKTVTVNKSCTIKARAVYLDQESNVASKTVTFINATPVNSIFEFNELPDNSTVVFNAPLTVIANKGDYLYVQDFNKGMLIYGHVSYFYNPGDVLPAGFKGTKVTVKGAPQLTGGYDFIGSGRRETLTPIELTPAQANLENVYRYAVIKRANIRDGKIVQGNESVTINNERFNVTLPTETGDAFYDITGIVGYSDGNQFMPMSIEASPETKYTITMVAPQNGRVIPSVNEAAAGESVTFFVTPDYGYELETLTYSYDPNPSGAFFTVTNNRIDMPASNIIVSAKFKLKTLNLTVTPNIANGTVKIKDGKTTATMGETITLEVTPATGYRLKSLTGIYPVSDGAGQGTLTPALNAEGYYTFTMPGTDVTISAEFEAAAHAINIPQVQNGRVSASPSRANAGETVTLTVTPDKGYKLGNITVTTAGGTTPAAGAPLRAPETIATTKVDDNTYTFVMPDADINIDATFVENTHTAISGINADNHEGLRYVSPSGRVSNRPFDGVNIVIDGNNTYKILK